MGEVEGSLADEWRFSGCQLYRVHGEREGTGKLGIQGSTVRSFLSTPTSIPSTLHPVPTMCNYAPYRPGRKRKEVSGWDRRLETWRPGDLETWRQGTCCRRLTPVLGWPGVAWCGMVWYSWVWYGTAGCCMVEYGMVWLSWVWCG